MTQRVSDEDAIWRCPWCDENNDTPLDAEVVYCEWCGESSTVGTSEEGDS
jgi:hypothetical protein